MAARRGASDVPRRVRDAGLARAALVRRARHDLRLSNPGLGDRLSIAPARLGNSAGRLARRGQARRLRNPHRTPPSATGLRAGAAQQRQRQRQHRQARQRPRGDDRERSPARHRRRDARLRRTRRVREGHPRRGDHDRPPALRLRARSRGERGHGVRCPRSHLGLRACAPARQARGRRLVADESRSLCSLVRADAQERDSRRAPVHGRPDEDAVLQQGLHRSLRVAPGGGDAARGDGSRDGRGSPARHRCVLRVSHRQRLRTRRHDGPRSARLPERRHRRLAARRSHARRAARSSTFAGSDRHAAGRSSARASSR